MNTRPAHLWPQQRIDNAIAALTRAARAEQVTEPEYRHRTQQLLDQLEAAWVIRHLLGHRMRTSNERAIKAARRDRRPPTAPGDGRAW
jgi:hypothetical protein